MTTPRAPEFPMPPMVPVALAKDEMDVISFSLMYTIGDLCDPAEGDDKSALTLWHMRHDGREALEILLSEILPPANVVDLAKKLLALAADMKKPADAG